MPTAAELFADMDVGPTVTAGQLVDWIMQEPTEREREAARQADRVDFARRRLGQADHPNVTAWGVGLGADVLSMGSRELGNVVGVVDPEAGQRWTDTADNLNRFSTAYDTAARERDGDTWGGFGMRSLRGAARSLPTTIMAGYAGGPYAAIGSAMATEGNQAVTEGKDAGLTGDDLNQYVAAQGAVEGVYAALMQRIGMGGLESAFAKNAGKELMKGGVKAAAKQGLKRLAQEIPEELATEYSHAGVRVASGVDPNALSPANNWRTGWDTLGQTVATMGMSEGPHIAAAATQASPEAVARAAAQQLPEVREKRRLGVDSAINDTNYVPQWVAREPERAAQLAATETPSRTQWEAAGLPRGINGQQRKAFADRVRQELAAKPQPDTRWQYGEAPNVEGDGVDSDASFSEEVQRIAEQPPPFEEAPASDPSLADTMRQEELPAPPLTEAQLADTQAMPPLVSPVEAPKSLPRKKPLPLTAAQVSTRFGKAKVEEVAPEAKLHRGGYRVHLSKGTLDILFTDQIAADEAAVAASLQGKLGRAPTQEEVARAKPAGAFFVKLDDGRQMPGLGAIAIATGSPNVESTLLHEAIHAGRKANIFGEADWAALKAKYAPDAKTDDEVEEAVAYAAQAWQDPQLQNPLKAYFHKLLDALGLLPKASKAMGKIQSGQAFDPDVQLGEVQATPPATAPTGAAVTTDEVQTEKGTYTTSKPEVKRVSFPRKEVIPSEGEKEGRQDQVLAPAAEPAPEVTPAQESAAEISPTTLADQNRYPVVDYPLEKLTLSQDVPQFKEDANEEGIVEGQQLQGEYTELGTGAILVWERSDGRAEVISGRHRFDLAKRNKRATIPSQVVREKDGFTAEMAAMLDAELNIRDEKGSLRDFATFFRNSKISEEQARTRGLLSRVEQRQAFRLGRSAGDDLYSAWRGGRLSAAKAAAIAEAAPRDDALQAAGLAQADSLSPDELKSVIALMQARSQDRKSTTQGDLFGFDDSALQDMASLAKAAASIQNDLKEERASIKGAAKRPDRAQKYLTGDFDTLPERVQELDALIDRWDRWTTDKELFAQAEKKAAEGKAQAKKKLGPKKGVPEARTAADTAQAEREQEGAPAEGYMGGGTMLRPRSDKLGKTTVPKEVQAPRPEVERQLQAAHGAHVPGILDKIKEHVPMMALKMVRKNAFIPQKSKRWAAVREMLRLAKQIPATANDEAARNVAAITDPLGGGNQLDLFTRKVVIDNLVASVERGEPLRFGFETLEEAKQYQQQLDALVAATPEVEKAIARRKQVVTDLVQQLVDLKLLEPKALESADTYYHQQVLHYLNPEQTHGQAGPQITKRSFQKARVAGEDIERFDETLNYNTNYLEAEASWMRDAYTQIGLEKWVQELGQREDKTKQFKARAKKEGHNNWRELVRQDKDYAIWQAEPGNLLYSAYGVPEHVVEDLLSRMTNEETIGVEDLRHFLALGGKKREMVLPTEVVQQLEYMKKQLDESIVARMSRTVHNHWKVWTLLNPKRAVTYNVRNMVGDTAAVAESAMGVLAPKYTLRALDDMRGYFGVGKAATINLSPDVQRARDLAVIDAAWSSELPDLKDLALFRRFLESEGKAGYVGSAMGKYFKSAKKYTQFRESLLRYASYLYYKDALDNRALAHYGGARKATVDALAKEMGNDVAAAHLSRNLLGDYGNMTVFGDHVRRHWFSFYAWTEVLLTRYPNVMYNAANYGGRKFGQNKAKAVAGSAAAVAAVTLPYFLAQVWNNLFFRDEEDELTAEERASSHLILGRNKDGSIILLRNVLPVQEWLEWFGLDKAAEHADMVDAGQMTVGELGEEMAKSVGTKVVSGLRPDIKAGFELSTGQTLFPDPTNPRRQPRDEIAVGYMGLRDEYAGMKGLAFQQGDRMRPNFWARMIGVSDPRKSAYYEVSELRDKFQQKDGEASYPTNRLMRNMREAAINGDDEAFREARTAYLKDGGDYDKFKQSIGMLDPLSRLADEKEKDFIDNYLTPAQRDKLQVAREYARQMEVEMWRQWKAAEPGDDAATKTKIRAQRLNEVKSKASVLLKQEPEELTTKQAKKGLKLSEKLREFRKDQKEAKQWLRSDAGLSRREVEKAVEAWIEEELSSEKGRAAKLKQFRDAMGW